MNTVPISSIDETIEITLFRVRHSSFIFNSLRPLFKSLDNIVTYLLTDAIFTVEKIHSISSIFNLGVLCDYSSFDKKSYVIEVSKLADKFIMSKSLNEYMSKFNDILAFNNKITKIQIMLQTFESDLIIYDRNLYSNMFDYIEHILNMSLLHGKISNIISIEIKQDLSDLVEKLYNIDYEDENILFTTNTINEFIDNIKNRCNF